jgi:arylsulfatase A-like enzyme
LIVIPAGRKTASRVRFVVQSLDLAPTLLDLAGVPPDGWPSMSGRSLVPLIQGAEHRVCGTAHAESPGASAYVEQTPTGLHLLVRQHADAPAAGRHEQWELFDLLRDAGAKEDLAPREAALLEAMLGPMRRHHPTLRAAVGSRPVSLEQQERLRALGYVR